MVDIPANQLVLSFSVILAALIVSGSIFFAAGSVSAELAGLAIPAQNTGGTGTLQGNNPVPQPTGDLGGTPPTGSASIASLMENPSFTEGDPTAPVVVVEFSDFECPFCRNAYGDAVKNIREKYVKTGKVLFVYQDFPLLFHPTAKPAAQANRCAATQGNDFAIQLHDRIFQMQPITDAALKQAAQDIGLDTVKFNECVDSKATASAVSASFQRGQQFGVNGTPTFFIGKKGEKGQQIVGAQPFATFDAAIQALLP